jgi:ssRNA-specific RNase YbeY (16S rRNA maturation enzyme)
MRSTSAIMGPTDVLTFDLRDRTRMAAWGEIALLGRPARMNGEALGHGVDAELALYAVHGVLHAPA